MQRDVFLSLLALDAYNRGYGSNVGDLAEEGFIGTASIREFQPREQDGWQAAGFYAIAYDWIGERVISFRGTNLVDGLPRSLPCLTTNRAEARYAPARH